MELRVGLQLYSIREALHADPAGALERAVAAGYTRLEAANGNAGADPGIGLGMPADEAHALLDRLGAQLIGSHVNPFDETNYRAVLDYHKALGSRSVVVPIRFFRDEADLAAACRHMNRMGEICEAEGVAYLYHNHYHEFQKIGGETILDIIAESTDPRYVGFEIDTFWAYRAGMDPVRVLRHFGTRVKAVHQKDFAGPGETHSPVNLLEKLGVKGFIPADKFGSVVAREDFAEIGTGRMDIQPIVDAAIALGSVEHIILEQDYTRLDPFESLRVSRAGLARFSGVSAD
ncbi:MAG: sugar phosphate isomerase/epimerase [Clostridia bacterium]|nr:sugar phosphate isomerase/epimerase [Clostridia bacterium]